MVSLPFTDVSFFIFNSGFRTRRLSMKKFFTLFLGLIFCACSGPSKIAPTVSSFTILGINTGKKLSIPYS